jgi:acetyl esterase/lipase
MKTTVSFLFAAILLLADPAALHAADSPSGQRHIYKYSAGQPQEIEVYFPPNHNLSGAKAPGLILFHGGSWNGGDLEQFRYACHYFASRGLVAATVNYRTLSKEESAELPVIETRKRVCITDAKSAIRWFKQHADEFGMDSGRIIAGGGSAGGHVSVLASMNPGLNDSSDPDGIDTSVAAYLLFNPAFMQTDVRDDEVNVLLHIKAPFAPALVLFGDKDPFLRGWKMVSDKLASTGNRCIELQIAEGQGHSFYANEPWCGVTLIAADRFLVKQGFLKGEPTLAMPVTGETLVPATSAEHEKNISQPLLLGKYEHQASGVVLCRY